MKKNRETNLLSYAKGLFENGFEKYDYYEFVAFSKYTNSLDWNRDKIENEIIRRCSEKDGYNLVMNYDTITNALKNRKRTLLKDVESIWITDSEVEFFKSVPEKYSKILFYVLVMARRDNPESVDKLYYNYRLNDAIRDSGVIFSEIQREEFNNWCGMNGYLLSTRSHSTTGKISWLLGYNKVGENSIQVIDFKKIISYFPRYCKQCGNKMDKKHSHGLCDECYSKFRKETVKVSTRKWRVNKN